MYQPIDCTVETFLFVQTPNNEKTKAHSLYQYVKGCHEPQFTTHCPNLTLSLPKKTEHVTAGAFATVYVWLLYHADMVYMCIEARHIPLHPLITDRLSFYAREGKTSKQCYLHFWDSAGFS